MDKVRSGFRTRERGDLPTGTCSACKGETYRVPEGSWLHWGTLGVDCPKGASKGQEGAMLGSGNASVGKGDA